MLTRSFIHIPGVGPARERGFWQDGMMSWDDILGHRDLFDEGPPAALEQELALSRLKLAEGDARWFEERLGAADAWRLAPDFDDGRTAYLDIECDGTIQDMEMRPDGEVGGTTVVAVWDGQDARVFLRGRDLDEIPEYLAKYKVLCTFNGKSFDFPYLERRLGRNFFSGAHLDLRPITSAVSLTGGLKKIEKQIGIERPADIRRYTGYDAVKLWACYKKGRRDALIPLARYCLYDTINLQTVLRVAYNWGASFADLPFRRFDDLQTGCATEAVARAIERISEPAIK